MLSVLAMLLSEGACWVPPSSAWLPCDGALASLITRHRTPALLVRAMAGEGIPPDDHATDARENKASDDFVRMKQELDKAQLKEFNSELYAHLSKRPEYETKELYSALRTRVDVDDPLYGELKERREILANGPSPLPTPSQTPGEVIELVLRALRDVDWPREGHGIELLTNYSSPASILGEEKPEVTPEALLNYFSTSKYSILLEWVSITYTRKLELSLDKRRALQQLRLTSQMGTSVPVTFQLSQHSTSQGRVWLIDQLLVKSFS